MRKEKRYRLIMNYHIHENFAKLIDSDAYFHLTEDQMSWASLSKIYHILNLILNIVSSPSVSHLTSTLVHEERPMLK